MKVFPNPTLADTQNNSTERLNNPDEYGMSLRDYFAAKAMQSIISKLPLMSETGNYGDKKPANEILVLHGNVCYTAYNIADQMMEARNDS